MLNHRLSHALVKIAPAAHKFPIRSNSAFSLFSPNSSIIKCLPSGRIKHKKRFGIMQKPNQKKASTLIPGASGGCKPEKRSPSHIPKAIFPRNVQQLYYCAGCLPLFRSCRIIAAWIHSFISFSKKITMLPDADIAGNLPAGLLPRINPLSSKLCPPNSRKPGNSLTNFVPRKSKPNDKHLPHCSRATNH